MQMPYIQIRSTYNNDIYDYNWMERTIIPTFLFDFENMFPTINWTSVLVIEKWCKNFAKSYQSPLFYFCYFITPKCAYITK